MLFRSGTKHIPDVKFNGYTNLCIDYKQMGLGGDDSWGAHPMERYLIRNGEYHYRFALIPFNKKDNFEKSTKYFKLYRNDEK